MNFRIKKWLLIFTGIIFSLLTFAESVDAIQFAKNKGINLFYDPLTQSFTFDRNSHSVVFKSGDDFIIKDGTIIIKEKMPAVTSDNKLIAEKSFMDQLDKLLSDDDGSGFKVGAILIDPGHGGKDPGANMVHNFGGKKVNLQEKDINLKTGLYLYDLLKKAYPDKQILMTRNTDEFITLQKRTDIANAVKVKENEAVLYVSIHVNASVDKTASGYEVWYLSPGYRREVLDKDATNDKNLFPILNSMLEEEYTTESVLIAKYITNGIAAQVEGKSSSRGIKAEEWFVCKNANMPSVLIELGFLTNDKEAALLNSEDYLKKLSLGIYNGLQAFVLNFETSKGFTGAE